MTMTHLSHFGLTMVGQSSERVVLEGTLAACKRMAFAHGCEISGEENFLGGRPRIARYWLKRGDDHGGMIHVTQDGWALVLPLAIWNQSI